MNRLGAAPGILVAGTAVVLAATLGGLALTGGEAASTPSPELGVSSASVIAAALYVRQADNVPYDGHFTFARIRFTPAGRGRCWGGGNFGEPSWAHDYPRAERNLMRILSETTYLEPYLGGGNIVWTRDEELFRHPFAYLSEPGCWTMEEDEVLGLRAFFEKGGFLIADDFNGRDWYNFEEQMRRVLPEGRFVELDASHPIFHSFFDIDERVLRAGRGWSWPQYYGIFENNDPSGRLIVVANYNNDIGDYWEWSDSGYLPIDLTNDAYKLGVNYIVYAMTH